NDIYVQWHRLVYPPRSLSMVIPQGAMQPLTASSYGYMILSEKDPVEVERIWRLIKVREGSSKTETSLQQLQHQLAIARRRGYYYARNSYLHGGGSLAKLLPVKIAGQCVAVGIGGNASELELNIHGLARVLSEEVAVYVENLKEFVSPGIAIDFL